MTDVMESGVCVRANHKHGALSMMNVETVKRAPTPLFGNRGGWTRSCDLQIYMEAYYSEVCSRESL